MTRILLAVVGAAALVLGLGSPPAVAAPAAPPLGWNDWYAFTCNVDEQLVEQTADAMVSSGMAAAGYDYVNLDDCWLSHSRDASGSLQADPSKFPDGIKAVADHVHALGLKLGIYEDVGTKTCAGYPGSYGHVQQDADTFASWGVDFVKVDWCNVPFGNFPGLSQQQVAEQLYTQYSQALLATGRPIFFSICEWNPALKPWTWAPAISNMWRSNNDYGDSWSRILANLDQEADLSPYAGPGHWNDPDILQVGLGGMTTAEDQAHFSAWSMLAAPLLAGNDLRSMSAATKAILTNQEVIAIDQDPLGAEATRLSHTADADVWTRSLANGDRAVMLLNRGDHPETISTSASDLGLPRAGAYSVRDLWAHRTYESAGTLAASVPAGSAVLYRVRPLRGDADRYAPLTDVSVTPDVPAVYPGSTYHIASPGQTIDVTADLRNDGRPAVTRGRLALSAPDGWTVTGRTATAPAVPGGGTLDGAWQVTVPPGTTPGTYSVTAHGTYRWHRGTRGGAVDGAGGFQVLVPPAGQPYASDLTPLASTNGYGPVLVNRSYFGGPLTIHGATYAHGLWTNAVASLDYYLGAHCTRLTADLGLDDSVKGTGTVDYTISADGQRVYDSGIVTNGTPTQHVSVDMTGAHVLRIDVGDGGDGISYDNADIAIPQLTCAS
jgi:alpha-galactosidase